MAENIEDIELVPFEVGLQAKETLLMSILGIVAFAISFLSMELVFGFKFTVWAELLFLLGGILLIVSQVVSRYNPLKTTRIPITGIILMVWTMLLMYPVLVMGWSVYTGSNPVMFFVAYMVIGLLLVGGLLVANFLTSLKILNWMSVDAMNTVFVSGVISLLAAIAIRGFNNRELIALDEVSLGQWFWLFVFAISFIIMLEMFNGSHRFNDIIKYAKERSTGEFSLTPVINNYYIMGFILFLIIGLVVLFILVLNFFAVWLIAIFGEQLSDSLMANSVYQLVFTMAVIFIPVWLLLIQWIEYRNRKETAEEDEMRRIVEKDQKLGIY